MSFEGTDNGRAVGARWYGPADLPVRLDLTLRPHEALSPEDFWFSLRTAGRAVPGSVRVVVLRGVSGLPAGDGPFDWSSSPAFVSVAALDAPAHGPALDLALGCDLRVVTPQAELAGPGPASAGALTAAIGYPYAIDLALTGRPVSGTEAFRLGLAQRLVPAEALNDEVERLVADLLAPDRDLVRELKALLLGAAERGARAQRAAQDEAAERLKSLRAHGAAQG